MEQSSYAWINYNPSTFSHCGWWFLVDRLMLWLITLTLLGLHLMKELKGRWSETIWDVNLRVFGLLAVRSTFIQPDCITAIEICVGSRIRLWSDRQKKCMIQARRSLFYMHIYCVCVGQIQWTNEYKQQECKIKIDYPLCELLLRVRFAVCPTCLPHLRRFNHYTILFPLLHDQYMFVLVLKINHLI